MLRCDNCLFASLPRVLLLLAVAVNCLMCQPLVIWKHPFTAFLCDAGAMSATLSVYAHSPSLLSCLWCRYQGV